LPNGLNRINNNLHLVSGRTALVCLIPKGKKSRSQRQKKAKSFFLNRVLFSNLLLDFTRRPKCLFITDSLMGVRKVAPNIPATLRRNLSIFFSFKKKFQLHSFSTSSQFTYFFFNIFFPDLPPPTSFLFNRLLLNMIQCEVEPLNAPNTHFEISFFFLQNFHLLPFKFSRFLSFFFFLDFP